MPVRGWEFWRLDTVDGGELAWLGITRPGARSPIDRTKVWTLVPALRMFIANWFVTEDHARGSGLWIHDNIHISEGQSPVEWWASTSSSSVSTGRR